MFFLLTKTQIKKLITLSVCHFFLFPPSILPLLHFVLCFFCTPENENVIFSIDSIVQQCIRLVGVLFFLHCLILVASKSLSCTKNKGQMIYSCKHSAGTCRITWKNRKYYSIINATKTLLCTDAWAHTVMWRIWYEHLHTYIGLNVCKLHAHTERNTLGMDAAW